jgi:uncharacterized protein
MSGHPRPVIFTPVKSWFLVLSPILVIGLGHATAVWGKANLGDYAWLPLTGVFWASMIGLLAVSGGWTGFIARLKAGSGGWLWPALAILVGLAPLPLLILYWPVLASPWIWLPWLVFAAINPFLEEGYWRGVLLDATSRWPAWLAVIYGSAVFAASHPLMWGTFSIANRTPETVIITFLMGVIWAVSYRRTGTLRWAVAAHVLTDLLNLSIAAFMNRFPTSAPLW